MMPKQQLIQSVHNDNNDKKNATVATVDCLARLGLLTGSVSVDVGSVSVDFVKLHELPPLLLHLIKDILITMITKMPL